MAKNISVEILAKEKIKQKITSLQGDASALRKSVTELSINFDVREKITLDMVTDNANIALLGINNLLRDAKEKASNLALTLQNFSFDNITSGISDISLNAQQAKADIDDLIAELNILNSNGGSSSEISLPGLTVGTQVDNTTTSNDNNSSDLTENSNNILSMAVSGATIGSLLGPEGTIAGVVVGLAIGSLFALATELADTAIDSATDSAQQRDDAVYTYVSDMYSSLSKERSTSISEGSAISANNESAAYKKLRSLGSSKDEIVEQLKQIDQTDGDAYQKLADEAGVSRDEMISATQNLVLGQNSYAEVTSNYQKSEDDINEASGDGYNDERKTGLEAQTEWNNSESGAELKENDSIIGQWQASLANLSDQYQRESLDALFGGDVSSSTILSDTAKERLQSMAEEYSTAKEAYYKGDKSQAAVMERLTESAKAMGTNEYNASADNQAQVDEQKTLIKTITEDAELNDAYWDAGYQMALQYEAGMEAAAQKEKAQILIADQQNQLGNYIIDKNGNKVTPFDLMPKNAYGLSYVPYNNYPAMLHEGERVLTASENRSYSSGGGSVVITGNSFTVREEADIEKVAKAIVSKINNAYAVAV